MKNLFNKKNITLMIAILWIIFSVGYVVLDQWQKFQVNYVQTAYQEGLSDSVKIMINESGKCVPIPLIDGETKVEMIAISCLQQLVSEEALESTEEEEMVEVSE